ncbi:dihydrofolate synthase [Malassezia yamatoensis]|uniref:Dihydrofolate synthase n=1 Tax=Malassezia yamatoensis TaxID=253288 RepID=A0AAJ5YSN4_9BASI|nr:dihydrofolate synthase [Malassezia yamatoensis]
MSREANQARNPPSGTLMIVLRSEPPLPHFCVTFPIARQDAEIASLRLSALRLLTGETMAQATQPLTYSEQLKQQTIQGWRLKMLDLVQVQGGSASMEDDEVALGLRLSDDHKCSALEHGDQLVVRLANGYALEELQLPQLPHDYDYAYAVQQPNLVSEQRKYTISRPSEPSSHSSSVQANPNTNFHAFSYPDYRQGYRVVTAQGVTNGIGYRAPNYAQQRSPNVQLDGERAIQTHQLAALTSMARANSAAGVEARVKLQAMGIAPPKIPKPKGDKAKKKASLPHTALVIGPGVQGYVGDNTTRARLAPVTSKNGVQTNEAFQPTTQSKPALKPDLKPKPSAKAMPKMQMPAVPKAPAPLHTSSRRTRPPPIQTEDATRASPTPPLANSPLQRSLHGELLTSEASQQTRKKAVNSKRSQALHLLRVAKGGPTSRGTAQLFAPLHANVGMKSIRGTSSPQLITNSERNRPQNLSPNDTFEQVSSPLAAPTTSDLDTQRRASTQRYTEPYPSATAPPAASQAEPVATSPAAPQASSQVATSKPAANAPTKHRHMSTSEAMRLLFSQQLTDARDHGEVSSDSKAAMNQQLLPKHDKSQKRGRNFFSFGSRHSKEIGGDESQVSNGRQVSSTTQDAMERKSPFTTDPSSDAYADQSIQHAEFRPDSSHRDDLPIQSLDSDRAPKVPLKDPRTVQQAPRASSGQIRQDLQTQPPRVRPTPGNTEAVSPSMNRSQDQISPRSQYDMPPPIYTRQIAEPAAEIPIVHNPSTNHGSMLNNSRTDPLERTSNEVQSSSNPRLPGSMFQEHVNSGVNGIKTREPARNSARDAHNYNGPLPHSTQRPISKLENASQNATRAPHRGPLHPNYISPQSQSNKHTMHPTHGLGIRHDSLRQPRRESVPFVPSRDSPSTNLSRLDRYAATQETQASDSFGKNWGSTRRADLAEARNLTLDEQQRFEKSSSFAHPGNTKSFIETTQPQAAPVSPSLSQPQPPTENEIRSEMGSQSHLSTEPRLNAEPRMAPRSRLSAKSQLDAEPEMNTELGMPLASSTRKVSSHDLPPALNYTGLSGLGAAISSSSDDAFRPTSHVDSKAQVVDSAPEMVRVYSGSDPSPAITRHTTAANSTEALPLEWADALESFPVKTSDESPSHLAPTDQQPTPSELGTWEERMKEAATTRVDLATDSGKPSKAQLPSHLGERILEAIAAPVDLSEQNAPHTHATTRQTPGSNEPAEEKNALTNLASKQDPTSSGPEPFSGEPASNPVPSRAELRYLEVQRELAEERARQDRAERHRIQRLARRQGTSRNGDAPPTAEDVAHMEYERLQEAERAAEQQAEQQRKAEQRMIWEQQVIEEHLQKRQVEQQQAVDSAQHRNAQPAVAYSHLRPTNTIQQASSHSASSTPSFKPTSAEETRLLQMRQQLAQEQARLTAEQEALELQLAAHQHKFTT